MTLTNSLLAFGVRFAAPTYAIKVTADGSASTLTFPASGMLGGDYFFSGDGFADDLLTLFKSTLETHTGIDTATVGFDSDFRLTVSATKPSPGGAAVLSIQWDDAATTLDKEIFGFAASTSLAATSLVGANQVSGLWRARRPLADDTRDRVPIVGGIARSVSGLTYTSRIATGHPERSIGWRLVPKEYVLTEYATYPRASFEYNWLYSASYGYGLRLYEDEATRTGSSYTLYRVAGLGDPITRSDQFSTRWDVSLDLVKEPGS